MKTIIVSAANHKYFEMLRGMINSVRILRPESRFGILDVGLEETDISWLKNINAKVVKPDWDFKVSDYIKKFSHYKAITSRPFLPKYFSEHDIILWIDPDVWVQERSALDEYINSASAGFLTATPERSLSYRDNHNHFCKNLSELKTFAINAGIFSLRTNAPHWKVWEDYFQRLLPSYKSGEWFGVDQNSFKDVIEQSGLPSKQLTALHNWVCHRSVPIYDPTIKKFRDPISKQLIGMIHCTCNTKNFHRKIRQINSSLIDKLDNN